MTTILILGGTGRAGFQVAVQLLKKGRFTICLSGRKPEKCQAQVNELKRQFPDGSIHALPVYPKDGNALADAFTKCDMVVNCAPLDLDKSPLLGEAKRNRVHLVDIVPGTSKHEKYHAYQAEAREHHLSFIFDAGFNPGLTLALANYGSKWFQTVKYVILNSLYKDPWMPIGSAKDILKEAHRPPFEFKNNKWQKVPFFKMKVIPFPRPFGKWLSFPIYAPEMERFPTQKKLKKFEMYQGRFNCGVNGLLFWWKILGLGKTHHGLTRGAILFEWLNRNLTRPPYGGALQLEVSGGKDGISQTITLGTAVTDLYEATALPVIATVQQLSEGKIEPGVGKMGDVVALEDFFEFLSKQGMSLLVHQS